MRKPDVIEATQCIPRNKTTLFIDKQRRACGFVSLNTLYDVNSASQLKNK